MHLVINLHAIYVAVAIRSILYDYSLHNLYHYSEKLDIYIQPVVIMQKGFIAWVLWNGIWTKWYKEWNDHTVHKAYHLHDT